MALKFKIAVYVTNVRQIDRYANNKCCVPHNNEVSEIRRYVLFFAMAVVIFQEIMFFTAYIMLFTTTIQ